MTRLAAASFPLGPTMAFLLLVLMVAPTWAAGVVPATGEVGVTEPGSRSGSPPSAPQNVTATAFGGWAPNDCSAGVKWTAPASSGSSGIADYELGWGLASGSYPYNRTPGPNFFGFAIALPLMVNVTYYFAVRANNSYGWGPWSSPAIATTFENFTVNATFAPATGAAPLTVAFHAAVAWGMPPYTVNWSFGDGSYGIGAWTNHTYTQTGTYYPCVTVNDSRGSKWAQEYCETSGVRWTIDVTPLPPPPLTSSFTSSISAGESPLTVDLVSKASGGSESYRYAWRFGDGGTSNSADPTHTFVGNTSFTVQLWVNDTGGNSSHSSESIKVWTPLTVVPTATPGAGVDPLNVTFNAHASGGGGPWPPSVSWEFGDGTQGSGPWLYHIYTQPGNYSVNVTVSDGQGDTVQATLLVSVTAPASCHPCPGNTGTAPKTSGQPTAAGPTVETGGAFAAGAVVGGAAILALGRLGSSRRKRHRREGDALARAMLKSR